MNKLYFGDCLNVLRDDIPSESVDLVYLDPPFNSNRNYNLLFKAPSGHKSEAQIGAFEDTWHWGEQAEREMSQLGNQPNTEVAEVMHSFRRFLGENDMMAYLVSISIRLIELHRVLRATGSLYLHCDPTASHYLRVLLDTIFSPRNFRNEIYWYYYNKMHDRRKKLFPRATDTLLFYVKDRDSDFPFHSLKEMREKPAKQLVRKKVDGKMVNARDDQGKLIYQIKEDRTLDNVWRIPCLQPASPERLGFPTQKPLALLERVIEASSNTGDVVLDPFCGCGTAVHAAHKLGRQWIGMDITHLAVSLIEKRLHDAFPNVEYEVHGTPKDLDGARDLANRDKYQFQWWACSLVGAQPWQDKKKGADRGIDGIMYFQDEKGIPKKIIVSVKGGEHVGRVMIADLKNTVEREKAHIGLFVTLATPTREMIKEAVSAGFYDSPSFQDTKFLKIQILTIEGLLDGTQTPRYPDLSRGYFNFQRTVRENEVALPMDSFFQNENEDERKNKE